MSDAVDPVAALRAAVRLPTIAGRPDAEATFGGLHGVLAEHFPRLHEHLERHRPAGHALLFRWPGRSAEGPVVLMAHQDVVPVDEPLWSRPPFSGDLVDVDGGPVVWGRGTLDDKGELVAVCAAVERLLADGFVPARDVWLSFGADEEVLGVHAEAAVDHLDAAGVRPWLVLDEGGAVAGDAFPGVTVPVAVVGVAEKGTTTLRLRVEGDGGHASTPARDAPPVVLGRALTRLDAASMPASVPAPTVELFRRIAPHLPRPLRPVARAALAGADRLEPLLARALAAAGPETAAMTRSTFAITTLSGSPAHNVVASTATAGVNVRVAIGDTVEDVVDHVARAVRDDRVAVEVVERGEASPVAPFADDAGFDLVTRTITEVFPDAVPAPYVMMAATDSRHFARICDRVYRFAPLRMSRAQRASIHGHDEHVGVADLLDGVRWYETFLRSLPEAP